MIIMVKPETDLPIRMQNARIPALRTLSYCQPSLLSAALRSAALLSARRVQSQYFPALLRGLLPFFAILHARRLANFGTFELIQ
jgi:hypothetical protein